VDITWLSVDCRLCALRGFLLLHHAFCVAWFQILAQLEQASRPNQPATISLDTLFKRQQRALSVSARRQPDF
jgi:hypothetical protein